MNDLISRQAAVEVAMQYCPDDDGSCSKADRDIRELLDDLENLPPSPTVTADTDTISRQDAIEHLKKRLYESALNNEGVVSETMEEIADNRIQIWMDELPPSPHRP